MGRFCGNRGRRVVEGTSGDRMETTWSLSDISTQRRKHISYLGFAKGLNKIEAVMVLGRSIVGEKTMARGGWTEVKAKGQFGEIRLHRTILSMRTLG
jgi:hypothetical protein